MTALSSHLEQISLCASSIAELSFPPPKMFTNALLHSHDITTLIRDTEIHERALFTLSTNNSAASTSARSRRQTVYPPTTGINETFSQPRRTTAVAAVLGGELSRKIRQTESQAAQNAGPYGREAAKKGDLDVELLLMGAEKLCGVYPLPGAMDKIAALRHRYHHLVESIAHYEGRVQEQSEMLSSWKMKSTHDDDEGPDETIFAMPPAAQTAAMTEEDVATEEAQIRQLEEKKHTLEQRVTGLEKDLGGILR